MGKVIMTTTTKTTTLIVLWASGFAPQLKMKQRTTRLDSSWIQAQDLLKRSCCCCWRWRCSLCWSCCSYLYDLLLLLLLFFLVVLCAHPPTYSQVKVMRRQLSTLKLSHWYFHPFSRWNSLIDTSILFLRSTWGNNSKSGNAARIIDPNHSSFWDKNLP